MPGWPKDYRKPLFTDKTASQVELARLLKSAERGETELADPYAEHRQTPLADQVRNAAASGRLRQGEPLPSLRPLAEELRINRNTIAKAYSGLSDPEILELDRWIRANTLACLVLSRRGWSGGSKAGFLATSSSMRSRAGATPPTPRIIR